MGHLRQRAMPYCLRYFIGAAPQAPIHICKTQERRIPMTIEDILKVLYGILGIWLGIGAVTHSLREPDGTESPIFVFGMICVVIGIVIAVETVAPGSIGTLIKSMFSNQ